MESNLENKKKVYKPVKTMQENILDYEDSPAFEPRKIVDGKETFISQKPKDVTGKGLGGFSEGVFNTYYDNQNLNSKEKKDKINEIKNETLNTFKSTFDKPKEFIPGKGIRNIVGAAPINARNENNAVYDKGKKDLDINPFLEGTALGKAMKEINKYGSDLSAEKQDNLYHTYSSSDLQKVFEDNKELFADYGINSPADLMKDSSNTLKAITSGMSDDEVEPHSFKGKIYSGDFGVGVPARRKEVLENWNNLTPDQKKMVVLRHGEEISPILGYDNINEANVNEAVQNMSDFLENKNKSYDIFDEEEKERLNAIKDEEEGKKKGMSLEEIKTDMLNTLTPEDFKEIISVSGDEINNNPELKDFFAKAINGEKDINVSEGSLKTLVKIYNFYKDTKNPESLYSELKNLGEDGIADFVNQNKDRLVQLASKNRNIKNKLDVLSFIRSVANNDNFDPNRVNLDYESAKVLRLLLDTYYGENTDFETDSGIDVPAANGGQLIKKYKLSDNLVSDKYKPGESYDDGFIIAKEKTFPGVFEAAERYFASKYLEGLDIKKRDVVNDLANKLASQFGITEAGEIKVLKDDLILPAWDEKVADLQHNNELSKSAKKAGVSLGTSEGERTLQKYGLGGKKLASIINDHIYSEKDLSNVGNKKEEIISKIINDYGISPEDEDNFRKEFDNYFNFETKNKKTDTISGRTEYMSEKGANALRKIFNDLLGNSQKIQDILSKSSSGKKNYLLSKVFAKVDKPFQKDIENWEDIAEKGSQDFDTQIEQRIINDYSNPDTVSRWAKLFGDKKAISILDAKNRIKKVFSNISKSDSEEEFRDKLAQVKQNQNNYVNALFTSKVNELWGEQLSPNKALLYKDDPFGKVLYNEIQSTLRGYIEKAENSLEGNRSILQDEKETVLNDYYGV